MRYKCISLKPDNLSEFRVLMELFGEVFRENETYQGAKPGQDYIRDFLSDSSHVVLVAQDQGKVIGGLIAYELKKFEQEKSEFFIYDLAVSNEYQRKGVGTALVEALKDIARSRGISTIFVQADKVDVGAIAFYKSLKATQTDTANFDIPVY